MRWSVDVKPLFMFVFCPNRLSLSRYISYLELADWILKGAVRSAREDNEWEHEMDTSAFKPGEIRYTKGKMGWNAKGAGIKSTNSRDKQKVEELEELKEKELQKTTIVAYEAIPAIATKTVKAQDVYKAAMQHDSFGVELQPLITTTKETMQDKA
jgi:hypothetical protein